MPWTAQLLILNGDISSRWIRREVQCQSMTRARLIIRLHGLLKAYTLFMMMKGWQIFYWYDPYTVTDLSDEYVFLLPFSDIEKIFEEMMTAKYAYLPEAE